MVVKTFEADNSKEAFERVKAELGRDAYILHMRKVRKKKGFLGLRGKMMVEVTAADEIKVRSLVSGSVEPSGNFLEKKYAKTQPSPPLLEKRYENELNDIRKMVEELVRKSRSDRLPFPDGHLTTYFNRMKRNDVPDDLARGLILKVAERLTPEQLKSPAAIQKMVVAYLNKLVRPYGPIRLVPKRAAVVALVGPTGVGKTTTIAKLAAMHKLYEQNDVGLITTDTYRIAAVSHLRTYADIMNLPLEVAQSGMELRRAIDVFRDKDVIFIDTAGRSQRDAIRMNELGVLMKAARPDAVHLVVSAVTHDRVMDNILERFSQVTTDSIILTKMDEAVTYGRILGIVARTRKPISYIATGQEVPADIEPARSAKLTEMILKS